MKYYIKKGMALTDETGISIPVCESNKDYIQACKDAAAGKCKILEWIDLNLDKNTPFAIESELLNALWSARKGMSNEAIKIFNVAILGV